MRIEDVEAFVERRKRHAAQGTRETGASVENAARDTPNTIPAQKKRHKFGARATRIGNEKHDSAVEAKRWAELQLAQQAGAISELERQVKIQLENGNGEPYLIRSKGYPNGRKASYKLDFRYRARDPESNEWNARRTIEDVKGYDIPISRLKRAIVEQMLGLKINVVRRKGKGAKARWDIS